MRILNPFLGYATTSLNLQKKQQNCHKSAQIVYRIHPKHNFYKFHGHKQATMDDLSP